MIHNKQQQLSPPAILSYLEEQSPAFPAIFSSHPQPSSPQPVFSSHPSRIVSSHLQQVFTNTHPLSSGLRQSFRYCWVAGYLTIVGVADKPSYHIISQRMIRNYWQKQVNVERTHSLESCDRTEVNNHWCSNRLGCAKIQSTLHNACAARYLGRAIKPQKSLADVSTQCVYELIWGNDPGIFHPEVEKRMKSLPASVPAHLSSLSPGAAWCSSRQTSQARSGKLNVWDLGKWKEGSSPITRELPPIIRDDKDIEKIQHQNTS